jgi:hypothetical protein
MSDNSKIEWTDATWSTSSGCDKYDETCKFATRSGLQSGSGADAFWISYQKICEIVYEIQKERHRIMLGETVILVRMKPGYAKSAMRRGRSYDKYDGL